MFGNFDIDFVIFGVMPYVALAVLLVGSVARYERDPFTWKSSSSQLLRRRQLMWGSILFHVGVLTVFFGHLVGLFTPVWVLDVLGIPYWAKQWLAVLIGGPAGLAALIGGTLLLHRRLFDPRIRVNSSMFDILIMVLLWLQLAIGLLTITQSLQHMDRAERMRFMNWAQSVVTLNINSWATLVDVNWLFKVHIFLGMIILMLFPFTRLVHILSGFAVPFRYLLGRSGYQIVRSRRRRTLDERRKAYDRVQGPRGPSASTPAEQGR